MKLPRSQAIISSSTPLLQTTRSRTTYIFNATFWQWESNVEQDPDEDIRKGNTEIRYAQVSALQHKTHNVNGIVNVT